MNRMLKTFFLWLLLATLPLQGVAAVVKATCGEKHHSMMVDSHDHHHDHAGTSPHHHGDAADHALASQDSSSTTADTDDVAKAATCSACAACCVGASAPPSSLDPIPELPASASLVISPAVAFVLHIPASLERPPQHTLA